MVCTKNNSTKLTVPLCKSVTHITYSSLQQMMKGVISHTVAAVHLFPQNDSSKLDTCVHYLHIQNQQLWCNKTLVLKSNDS